ncbi:hypothetical protein D0T84_07915 [Dysgonomonas sp. 521]|uniref:hypothetical protein n=1 Tax=Dysgonomonas sp. 521 TaxID=2302932 RepID=UPI0013D73A09|nr:hypothetical protein [Dysgonomonas sp. 521]NDV94843.1 hypothetical protein [Dysgonomonas sp. 521]
MEIKHCGKCGQDKPKSEFYTSSKAKDRLQGWCKKCMCNKKSGGGKNEPLGRVKSESFAGVNKRPQSNENNPLSNYTPRELMRELHDRGYEGVLTYTAKINISQM